MVSSVGPGRWPCLIAGWVRGTGWGGSKPELDPGRLHGLVHDRQQLTVEGVEVELIAQADACGADHRGARQSQMCSPWPWGRTGARMRPMAARCSAAAAVLSR